MLRFILKRETFHEINQMRQIEHSTLDVDVHDLEKVLRSGGMGESGFDITTLVAVVVLPEKIEHRQEI